MCAVKDDKSVAVDRELDQEKSLDPSAPHIRCSLSGWLPRKDDRWSCDCGHLWNTFETRGVCPACLHQRTSTQCLFCPRWSLHSNWYTR
jgi:rubrerythrin